MTGYYANLETAATEAADGARHHVDSAPRSDPRCGLVDQRHATSSTDVSNSRRVTVAHDPESVVFVEREFRCPDAFPYTALASRFISMILEGSE
jgi:hypothetical protein